MSSASRIASRALWLGVGASCCLFLLFWAQLALSSRLSSDDFCAAGLFRHYGMVGTVLWWRAHVTGRWFSQGLVAGASYYFLLYGRPFLYAFGLLGALWIAGMWAWTGFGFLRPRARNLGDVVVGALCVLLLLSAVFALTPTPSEVWFWVAGSGVHSVPVVLLLVVVGVLARGTAPPAHLGSIAVAALIVGGCSETSIVLAFFALAYGASRMKGERRRLAIVGLGCLLCSAIFALSAPGNFIRLHAQTAQVSLQPLDVVKAVQSVVRAGFVLKWHSWLLLLAIATTLSPEIGALFPRFPRRFGRAFWFGIPCACAVSLIPAVIAFHGPFPLRTLSPVTFCAVIWVSAAGVQLGLRALDANRVSRLTLLAGGVFCTLAFAGLWSVWIWKQVPIVRRAARTFDRNYAIIRATGPACTAVLKVEKPMWQRWVPIGVPEPSANHWISRCMSKTLDSCPLAQK